VEQDAPLTQICRWMGVSPTTFYVWKKRFAGMAVADVRKTKQLEDEVRRLAQLVAYLSLDNQVADVERGPRDEDDFLRTAVGVLRAVDAGVAYPVRGWACRGCQYSHACKPKRPKLAMVA